jgi:patatin-like phospholipase/acyl hydrolase
MQARLDWYTDEEAYAKSPSIRRTIYLEQMEKVNILSENGFEVVTKNHNHPYKFRAETSAEVSIWTNHLIAIKNELLRAAESRRSNCQSNKQKEEDIYAAPEEGKIHSTSLLQTLE